MISNFNEFLNENSSEKILLFYSFDWDDNILHMPTVIHMQKNVNGVWRNIDVSTSDFAKVRSDENYRILDNDPDKAFSEFRDFGLRGNNAFLMDTISSIKNGNFGPSWDDFIECLISGCIFSIITARGHESESIRKSIEWIIDNYLSNDQKYEMYNNILKFAYLYRDEDKYDVLYKDINNISKSPLISMFLSNCYFVGVSNPKGESSATNPEKAKQECLLKFKRDIDTLSKRIGVRFSIGFSDDDIKNVKHIEDLMNNLNHEDFSNLYMMVVKNTNDVDNITKTTRKFEDFRDTSVLSVSNFDNMTSNMTDVVNNDINKIKHIRSVEKIMDFTKEIKKKRKKK